MRDDTLGPLNEDGLGVSEANDCPKSVLRPAAIDECFTHVWLPSGDSTCIPLQQMRRTARHYCGIHAAVHRVLRRCQSPSLIRGGALASKVPRNDSRLRCRAVPRGRSVRDQSSKAENSMWSERLAPARLQTFYPPH